MKYLGKITDNKDLVTKEYVDAYHLPIKSKTYTNVVASANTDPGGWYYFATVTPDNNDYTKLIYVKYRIRATAAGRTDAYSDSIVEYYFYNNAMLFYRTDNAIKSTSYRAIYNHIIYRAKQAGLTAGYGHLLGVRLQSSWNPTTAANARTIVVDVLETHDCSVNFFDSMTLYANVPGTGTTNYDGRGEYNGTDQGDRHTGDANDTTTLQFSTSRPTAGSNGIYQYNIIMMRPDGTWESLTAASGTGTSKAKNTHGFVLGQMYLYWSGSNITSGNVVGTSVIRTAQDWVDFRYTSNCGTTLTAHKMIYLKGTITGGLFYLADTWWTQTLPTTNDGFIYIPVGYCYGNGYSYCFWGYSGAYYHNGTTLVECVVNARTADDAYAVNGHTVAKDVPSDAKFTDTVTTATTSGSGNAVTAITASNGALTVTKGTTFLTSHQDISGKADKSATVSTVTWDSTNKKLTKTINGTTSDVVTAATLRTGLNVADGAEVNQNAFSNVKVGSTTVAADTKTDTLELVAGSNVTLTPDATNDKVTIAATDTTYESKSASSGGTAVSLVTTGEKYTWNNKQNALTNPVTGTGTSGYLAKFNGTSTITNGPQLGSSTTTFLRNDGTWATPASGGDVSGVKGDAESSYRTGNVNITPANLGLMNGTLDIVAGNNVELNYLQVDHQVTISATDTTYESKSASSGGTAVSLVTTGEKYTWNNKQNALTNPVTGTGTSGYLAKFNGTTTVTNGPQFGSSTTTYLRNDGSWETPPGTVTTATTSGSGNAVTAITASNGALTVTKGTTFLTSHQDISGKADKSATVSTVAWDSTNKKLTKTINGTTTDVVTAATLRTGLNVADGAEVNQNAFSNVKVGSTTVAADAKTDTLELVAGSNVTLTPDATNDKVTIAATDTTYESKAAASGGTAVSLVTTGEKYTWNNKLNSSEKGSASGVCPLNSSTKVDSTYMPYTIHISTSDPTSADGANGDIWLKYVAPSS